MRAARILVVVIGLLSVGAEVAAQNRVQIFGTVLDDRTEEPIAGVDLAARTQTDVFLKGTSTDEAGRFSLTVYRTSAVRLFAARLGYKRTSTPLLHFDGNDYFELELRLDPDALLLAPLEVIARNESVSSPILAGFRHRMTRGMGFYITRAEIERRQPLHVTDMLLEVPGVRVASGGGRGGRRVLTMGRSSALNCPVQLFVDGHLMTPRGGAGRISSDAVTIDDVVAPGSVEGIEVYRGLSTLPPEFYNEDAKCGVIAIWTRRGGEFAPSSATTGGSPR